MIGSSAPPYTIHMVDLDAFGIRMQSNCDGVDLDNNTHMVNVCSVCVVCGVVEIFFANFLPHKSQLKFMPHL